MPEKHKHKLFCSIQEIIEILNKLEEGMTVKNISLYMCSFT